MSLLPPRLRFSASTRDRLSGFTLIEVLVSVLIFGILASLAIFSFSNAMTTAEREKAETALVNAGLAIDKEVVDNNGLYPTYLPNEIRQSEEMGDRLTYTYAANRGSWCLAVTTNTQGTLYLPSGTRQVQTTSCAQAMSSDNSNEEATWTYQWTPPVPTFSNVNVTWPSSGNVVAETARIETSLATGECTAEDNAVRGNTATVHTKYKVTNTTRNNSHETGWIANSTGSAWELPAAWAPTDQVQVQVMASCIVNAVRYDHAPYGAPSSHTIPSPTIAPPTMTPADVELGFADDIQTPSDTTYNENPGTLIKRMSWTPVATCPSTWTTKWSANIKRASDKVTHWAHGSLPATPTGVTDRQSTLPGAHNYTMNVWHLCIHPAGVQVNSTTVVQVADRTPVKRPKMAVITSVVTNPAGASGYANIQWGAVTCDWPATVSYRVTTQGPQGMWQSAWQTSTEATIPISASGATVANVGARCEAAANGGGMSGVNTGPAVSVNG